MKPPPSLLTPSFMGRAPRLIYYINFIMIHPHTVRVLVIVKCVFDGPGFGNINNINQIALYLFVSSRGRERSSFFCSVNRYLQYNTGIKNTRASSLIWCRTCHPNPILRCYDVTVAEQCSYAKTSSREPSIFIAHIDF